MPIVFCLFIAVTFVACEAGTVSEAEKTTMNFDTFFPKYINVFGVSIRGTSTTPNAKMLHAAHVMAEYLDNDADGAADDPNVVEKMRAHNATLVMTIDRDELDDFPFANLPAGEFQDLNAAETLPNGVAQNRFDATLEEVLHLISHVGYANAYPDVFGETAGTRLADAMDLARGGRFETIPTPYPAAAWYSYDDHTCEYNCMITEYFYWALTTKLGAQDFPGRAEEIGHEWRPNTAELLAQRDPAIFELLGGDNFNLPTILPSGHYRGGPIKFLEVDVRSEP
jgi:hypothetical protein